MLDKFKWKFTGQNKMKVKIKAMGNSIPRVAASALHMEHESIMTQAKIFAPVLTGALESSGHVTLPTISGNSIISIGGFGGSAVAYAATVHETHRTKSKFYERALNAAVPGMANRLARIIKAII